MYGPALITAADALRRHGRESELEVLRRMHREQLAAERASRRKARSVARRGRRRLARPAIALWTLVTPRR